VDIAYKLCYLVTYLMLSYVNPGPFPSPHGPLAQLMCLAHGDTSSQPPPPLSLDSGQIHPQLPSPADQPRWRRCKQQASPPSPWTLARITPSCLKSIHTPAQQVSLSPGVAQLSQSSEISQKEKSHLASSTCEHHASLATLFPT